MGDFRKMTPPADRIAHRMDQLPMSNRALQNLHRDTNLQQDTIVFAISTAVINAAANGEKRHNTYIRRKVLMSYSHDILKYVLSKVRKNFPGSAVFLKVVVQGQHRKITLSDLSLALVSCTLNEEARVAICVDWSSD